MSWAIILTMQAATPLLGLDRSTFDLRTATPISRCAGGGDEIVVCGRQDSETYRLRDPRLEAFEPKPLRAEIGIVGDVSARVHGEQVEFPGGVTSQRAMVTLKVPF